MSGNENALKYDKNMTATLGNVKKVNWHFPQSEPFVISGLGWTENRATFRRMPVSPARPLPKAVDSLANHPSGIQVRFSTDSKCLSVRAKLKGSPSYMSHMAATGIGGIDCYVDSGRGLRFCNCTKFDSLKDEYEMELFDFAENATRYIVLNLPLYQGVESLEIGLEEGCSIDFPPPYCVDGPVVVYGTSITQGGCATRPGMSFTNILSRRLNAEFINLGFSGSGKGEPEVAAAIASMERTPSLLVLDYCGNVNTTEYENTLPSFYKILRERFPDTPILLLPLIRFAQTLYYPDVFDNFNGLRQIADGFVKEMRGCGDERIFYHDMESELGEDFDDCTVDGVHATDLGFYRMADSLEPVIRNILSI